MEYKEKKQGISASGKPLVMKFRRSLFWDVDPKTIDPEKHAEYIIERVLDFGDNNEVRWVIGYYAPRLIKDTLRDTRVLSFRSANFWAQYFDIKREELKCFQEPYLTIRKQGWPY